MSIKWLLRVLKAGREKMLTSSKNNINILSSYNHKKNRHPKLKRFFLLQTTYLHESLEV